jgi:hypothetical protein
MQRLLSVGVLAMFTNLLSFAPAFGQGSPQDSAATSSPAQNATPPASQPPNKPSTSAPNPTKPSKVWTNENLAEANGHVSVVGDPKNASKGGGSGQLADPQYIANTRKQLEKLQSELADTDKKLADLKKFTAGESVSYSGYQYRKGYDREPVDAKIRDLEEKKKQTQAKIDSLLDEARKKGIDPGQLR